mgnify:CR=1 FL=1
MIFDGYVHQLPDTDPAETEEWLDSLDSVIEFRPSDFDWVAVMGRAREALLSRSLLFSWIEYRMAEMASRRAFVKAMVRATTLLSGPKSFVATQTVATVNR